MIHSSHSPFLRPSPLGYNVPMNPSLSRRRLQKSTWRRRYQTSHSALLHFKLTLQTLALPDDPVPEKLPTRDLERFLLRLIADLERFTDREIRFLEAGPRHVSRWRFGYLLAFLELFDETSSLGASVLPDQTKAAWRALSGDLIRLKALVVRRQLFG